MTKTARPPRDDLFRALYGTKGIGLRATDPEGDAEPVRTLFGHFAVFNQWTEISSMWEGNFLEQIAPGAFRKTFREGEQKCLFQHGYDFIVGDKPLGPFSVLREDDIGAYYEVPLLDTSYNADLIPGLDANLYGASFRFRVLREEYNEEPGVSDHNPKGLPERTIKEVECFEGGPVTFGAYDGATAGLRSVSLCDEFLIERFARNPERTRALAEARAERVAARGGEPEDEDAPLTPAVEPVPDEPVPPVHPPTDPDDLPEPATDDEADTDLPAEVEADDAPPAEDEEAGRRDDTPAEAPDGRSTPVAAPLYLGQESPKPDWLLP